MFVGGFGVGGGGGGILRGVACRLIVPILRVLRNHSTLANGRDTMLQ